MSSTIDNELLIALVFDKRPVWDKRHKHHSKRYVTDKCWKEISLEMKQDENALRKRWRYLRDQFAVEYGKIPPFCSGDDTIAVYPKWPYFKSLLFLKNIVKPRVSTARRTRSVPSPASSDHTDQGVEIIASQSTPDIDCISVNIPPASPIIQDDVESGECTAYSTTASYQTTVRRNKNNNDTILENENQILRYLREKEITRHNRRQEEDDDIFLFFKSLIPHVRKIPPHMQLSFRNRIHNVVEEFAYPSHFNTVPISHNSSLTDNSQHRVTETDHQNHRTVIGQSTGDNGPTTTQHLPNN